MTYHIARAAGRQWSESAAVLGLRHATLINAVGGASHLEVRLYELRAGTIIPAHRHPFEESWYVFSGRGQRTVAGLTYQVAAGDYGSPRSASATRLLPLTRICPGCRYERPSRLRSAVRRSACPPPA